MTREILNGLRPETYEHIWDLNRRQKEADEIEMETGSQCLEPYECWYYSYCHGEDLCEDTSEGEDTLEV